MELPNKSEPEKVHEIHKSITPTASGVTEVKRPATRRFKDFVLAESPKAVGMKVGRDIVAPRLRMALRDAVVGMLDGVLGTYGGNSGSTLLQQMAMRGGGVNYAGFANPNPGQSLLNQAANPSPVGGYQDLAMPTQQMAENTLAQMLGLMQQYNRVSVGDFKEMVSITPQAGDSAYGWLSLDGARITQTREGYVLALPRPSRL